MKFHSIITNLSHRVYTRTSDTMTSCLFIMTVAVIREYGSTLYVGMARKKNGRPYISIANGKLKSLVIYTNK